MDMGLLEVQEFFYWGTPMRSRLALALIAAAVVVTPKIAAAQTWYYCDPARAYYPYVVVCSAPWRAVNPVTALPQPYAAPPIAQSEATSRTEESAPATRPPREQAQVHCGVGGPTLANGRENPLFNGQMDQRSCDAIISAAQNVSAGEPKLDQIQRCVALLDQRKSPPGDHINLCEEIVAAMAPHHEDAGRGVPTGMDAFRQSAYRLPPGQRAALCEERQRQYEACLRNAASRVAPQWEVFNRQSEYMRAHLDPPPTPEGLCKVYGESAYWCSRGGP